MRTLEHRLRGDARPSRGASVFSTLLAALSLLAAAGHLAAAVQQPTWLSVDPFTFYQGDCYTMSAGNAAYMTLDYKVRLDGGPEQVVIGFPTLDGWGRAVICVPDAPAPGQWLVTAVRNTHATAWVPVGVWAHVLPKDFSLSVSPAGRSVQRGQQATYTVSASPLGSFNDVLSLSVSGLGAGKIATWSSAWIAPGQSATLTIRTTSSAATGTDAFSVIGSGGGMTHSVGASLAVTAPPQPTSLTASPATVVRGNPYTITVGGGGSMTIDYKYRQGGGPEQTAIGLPLSAAGTFTFQTDGATFLGETRFTAIRNTHNTAWVPVDVPVDVVGPDFMLNVSPAFRTVQRGHTTSFTISITPQHGWTAPVSLELLSAPPGVNAGFSRTSLAPGESSTLTFSVPYSAAAQSDVFTLRATGGGKTHSLNRTLVIQDPPQPTSLSASPATVALGDLYTITVGGGAWMIIDYKYRQGGGAEQTAIGVQLSSAGTYTFQTGGATFIGETRFTAIRNTRNTAWVPVDVPVDVVEPDFTLNVTPLSLAVQRGQSGSFGISITPQHGWTTPVDLELRSLDPGTSATFSRTTLVPGQSSTLTFSVPYSAVAQPDNFSVWATGGGRTRSRTRTLVIEDPPQPTSLAASPASLVRGNPYTIAVGGGASMTIDYKFRRGEGAEQTLTGLQLSPAGTFTFQTDGETFVGVTRFTAIRNTHNTAWVPVDVTVRVTDFALRIAPGHEGDGLGVPAGGGGGEVALELAPQGGFSDPVALSVGPHGVPPGVTFAFAPASIAPGTPSTLTATVASAVPPGEYPLQVRALSGGVTRTLDLPFGVVSEPIELAVSPGTVTRGQARQMTLTGDMDFTQAEVAVASPMIDPEEPRTPPTVVWLSRGPGEMVVEVDAAIADLGLYALHVTAPGASGTVAIRVTDGGPVIDIVTPVAPMPGQLHVLVILGDNLDGATISLGTGGVILGLQSSPTTVTGLLWVEPGTAPGPLVMEVTARGGKAMVPMDIPPPGTEPAVKSLAVKGSGEDGLPEILYQTPRMLPSTQVNARIPAEAGDGALAEKLYFCIPAIYKKSWSFTRIAVAFFDEIHNPLTQTVLNQLGLGRLLRLRSISLVITGELSLSIRSIICTDGYYEVHECFSGSIRAVVPGSGLPGVGVGFEICIDHSDEHPIGVSSHATGILSHTWETASDSCVQIRDDDPQSTSGDRSHRLSAVCCGEPAQIRLDTRAQAFGETVEGQNFVITLEPVCLPFSVDLVLDGLPEESEPSPNEEEPGGVVVVNDDDDDHDLEKDRFDDFVPEEDDLIPLDIDFDIGPSSLATLSLEASANGNDLRVWRQPTKGDNSELDLPLVWSDPARAAVPRRLWIEGWTESSPPEDGPGDVELVLTAEFGLFPGEAPSSNPPNTRVSDRVRLRVEPWEPPCLIFVHGKRTDELTFLTYDAARNYWREATIPPPLAPPPNDFVAIATQGTASHYVVGYKGNVRYSHPDAAGHVAWELLRATDGLPDDGGNACRKTWAEGGEFWVVAHSMGGLVMDYILGNATENSLNVNSTFFQVGQRIDLVITLGTPHRGSEGADQVCAGVLEGRCELLAEILDDCGDATEWLQTDDIYQVSAISGPSVRPIWMTGGFTGFTDVTSACLSGEDDGVVQFASIYACAGDPTASYTADTICGNGGKMHPLNLSNLDTSAENHDEIRNASQVSARRDAIRDGFWRCSGLPCQPGEPVLNESTADVIHRLYDPPPPDN